MKQSDNTLREHLIKAAEQADNFFEENLEFKKHHEFSEKYRETIKKAISCTQSDTDT